MSAYGAGSELVNEEDDEIKAARAAFAARDRLWDLEDAEAEREHERAIRLPSVRRSATVPPER